MKRKYESRVPSPEPRTKAGSALILAVVLTSLLAVVGVMFVMLTRVDKISTSAVIENKELNFAVDSIIARISRVLAEDVPGFIHPVDANLNAEYHDYPYHTVDMGLDITNPVDDIPLTGRADDYWLASLEPELVDVGLDKGVVGGQTVYGFRHITDLYGKLAYLFQHSFDYSNNTLDYLDSSPAPFDDRISFRNLRAWIIDPSAPIIREGDKADADGDGVADSRWVIIPNMTSSKGRPIYAAVRIVDNCAMLNVNTAFKNTSGIPLNDPFFDPNTVDGSSQMQINLTALAARGTNPTPDDRLRDIRCGSAPRDILSYDRNVVWRYIRPLGAYTPFDISDELKFRNRYILNYDKMTARIENLWSYAYEDFSTVPTVPRNIDDHSIVEPNHWFWYANNSSLLDPLKYDYHHISTTYNMDRIIDPAGQKMFNVNDHNDVLDTDAWILWRRLRSSIDRDLGVLRYEIEDKYAQLAVNLVDFADNDPCVTTITVRGRPYYGFEAQPFITELAMKIDAYPERADLNYYAVELYNPFDTEIDLTDFRLISGPSGIDVNDPCSPNPLAGHIIGRRRYVVISNKPGAFAVDPCSPPAIWDPYLRFFGGWKPPDKTKPPPDRRRRPDKKKPPVYVGWTESYDIYLARMVKVNGSYVNLYFNRQPIDFDFWPPAGTERYYGRNPAGWHVVYPDLDYLTNVNTLGGRNTVDARNFRPHRFSLALPNPYHFQHPYKPALVTDPLTNRPPRQQLITIGDIPQILTIGPGPDRAGTVGRRLLFTPANREYEVRLNLQDPLYANIFQYLTVFDPSRDFADPINRLNPIDNDGDEGPNESLLPTLNNPLRTPEFKVPGRININTAPWFVIAQLPWVTPQVARAIVAYRDKQQLLDISGNPVAGAANYTNRFNVVSPFLAGLPYIIQKEHIREVPGLATLGELNFVLAGNREYRLTRNEPDGADLQGFPDLTTHGPGMGDDIVDDFEERDVLFSRISNLVTVRSDVFTAYILVRIGRDGPQKRVIAILDRSDVYPSGTNTLGQVKIRALHPVPDPR